VSVVIDDLEKVIQMSLTWRVSIWCKYRTIAYCSSKSGKVCHLETGTLIDPSLLFYGKYDRVQINLERDCTEVAICRADKDTKKERCSQDEASSAFAIASQGITKTQVLVFVMSLPQYILRSFFTSIDLG
jgi:hypothetical protein